MHLDAYVASLIFLPVLNVLIDFIKPIVPIEIRSSIPIPVFSNFLAIYTTNLKFLSTNSCLTDSSPLLNLCSACSSSSDSNGGGSV